MNKLTRNTNKILQTIGQFVLAAAIFLAPASANAVGLPTPNCSAFSGLNCTQTTGFTDTVVKIINIVLGVVFIIAVAMLVYGAFRYMVAGGNDEAVKTARKTITNALIGIALIILSYVIVSVVVRMIGNFGSSGPI